MKMTHSHVTVPAATASSPLTPIFIPEHVRQKLEANGQLQVLPHIGVRAVRMAEDPDCSTNDFVDVVECDLSLVTGLLRFANSAFYSNGKPLINVRQAAIRLGIRTCRNLVLTSCISSLMGRMSMKQEWIRAALARHGFMTATICHELNRILHTGFDGEEFTCGLVHDIGRTLLATCFTEEFLDIDSMTFVESRDSIEAEEKFLGTTHCEVGAWFASSGGLPDALVDVILHHHSPEDARNPKLALLVAASDHMANHMQRFDSPEDYCVTDNAALVTLSRPGVGSASLMTQQEAIDVMKRAEVITEELQKL